MSTDYDRTCAGISKEDSDDRAFRGERYTIRLKAPDAYPAFKDVVYGGVGKPTREARKLTHGQQVFEDPILLKSDGWPTYHLANVVDDHLMKITHVVRAVEWMPSTPKHVYLYQAFGWTPPVFAHVGLLQGPDNQKLSKRSGDIDIGSYRSAGVFPEALLNFAALLGWHHKQKSDMIELEQMISLFNFNLTKGNTVVNIPKLNYLSREYAKKYVQEGGKKFQDILQASITNLERHGITQAPRGKDLEEYVSLILRADPTSILDMANLSERLRSFFEWYPEDKAMLRKPLVDAELLDLVYHDLRGVDDKQWSADIINSVIQGAISQQFGRRLSIEENKRVQSGLFSDLRSILLDSRKGPGMAKSMEILGRDETLERLAKAGPFSGSISS